MKVIKNINNNYAIAIDGSGKQLIVSGRGIGFGEVPREITNLSAINQTFYDIDEEYIQIINSIPEEIIDISAQIISYARNRIDNPISSSIVFTLADHINFSINRYRKNMNIKLPILYDVEHLFEKEMEAGLFGINLIKRRLKVLLPKDEAAYIALHILNAEEKKKNVDAENELIVEEVTGIVEKCYQIKLDRNDFNYSRFVSHLHYLLKRGRDKKLVETINYQLFETIRENYQQTYECVEKISSYLLSRKIELNPEEKLYLMLHINRLCTREDCNQ